jgi:hypothetical protein
MKIVYIAHPLNAPTEEARAANRENAAKWAAWIVLSGVLSEDHRELGLACDLALIERCAEVWLVGGRVSPGMRIEADHAHRKGIPVRSFILMGWEAPGLNDLPTQSHFDAPRLNTDQLSSGTVSGPQEET